MASLMPSSLDQESPVSKVPFVLSLWRMRSMGLRRWKTAMRVGRAEAMHCTRASIYTQLPVNCLSFWMVQSWLSQSCPGSTSRGSTP